MNIIAIDCGASFVKGARIQDGKIAKCCRRQAPAIHKDAEILHAVQIEMLVSIVYDMVEELVCGLEEAVLCISNEMHGFLLAKEDGQPYTDYISWQHEYGTRAVQFLTEKNIGDELLHTGMPLRAGLPSCNLLYLSQNGYLDDTKSELHFYTMGDYLLKRLSGGLEPCCHATNAAATGLYDLRSGTWNPLLVQVVGAEHIVFPDIGIRPLQFLLHGVKITAKPAVGDQQAALYGAGLDSMDMLSFNIGTGAQVSRLVYQPDVSSNYQIRPYMEAGTYLKTIPHLPAGRALNVYVRFICDILEQFEIIPEEEKLWEVLLKAEEHARPAKLKCDLSFFENAVTDHTFGAIAGIEEYGLTVGNLMHTVFQQMAANFIAASQKIVPDRQCIRRVVFSGGIAQKIEKVRKYIMEHFKEHTEVIIASDETLAGLYKYGTK